MTPIGSNVLSSFISQFYENKTVPKLVITSHKINEKKLLEKNKPGESLKLAVKEAQKKEEKSLASMAEKNAKQSLTQKLIQSE